MGIFGIGAETYLYIQGLIVKKEIQLNSNKILMPTQGRLPVQTISKNIKNDIDFAMVVLCSNSVHSQLRITNENPKDLAVSSWNSQWDLILLSAIYNCEAMCNIQCTHPVDAIKDDTELHVTNYFMHGLFSEPYTVTDEDIKWLNEYFANAQLLLKNDSFCTAIHSMASYRWHSMPRVQLAILWAGIESLFHINSELSFRISLYISNFLAGSDKEEARRVFNESRSLYNARSSAVHGGNIKGDLSSFVEKSASLLKEIIRRCIMINNIPNIDDLVY